MGIFKEEIIFLEELAKNQSRIWNDACDVGVNSSDVDMQRMREVIKTLLRLPGSKIVWKADTPSIQRQYELIVMWSLYDRIDGKDLYDATKVNVLYFNGRGKEFFSIMLEHAYTNKDGVVQ